MRKVFLSLLFLLASYFSFGQTIAVSTDRNNIVYIDVDNPITIAAENHSSQSLIVTTNNGTIEGNNGRYLYKPKSIGKGNIYVSLKKGGKITANLRVFEFRVKRLFDIPNIIAAVGPCRNNCEINKTVLEVQEFVRGEIVNTEFDARVQIDSFSVYIYSNDTCKIIHKTGNRITEDIKQEFRSLSVNDVVVFKNIVCILPDKTLRNLDPLMLFIKD